VGRAALADGDRQIVAAPWTCHGRAWPGARADGTRDHEGDQAPSTPATHHRPTRGRAGARAALPTAPRGVYRARMSEPESAPGSSPSTEPRRAPARRVVCFAPEQPYVGTRFAACGALWMPWERRGDFARVLRGLRETHGVRGAIHARAEHLPFLEALVDEVFRRRWLNLSLLLAPVAPAPAALDPVRHHEALVDRVLAAMPPRPLVFHLRASSDARTTLGRPGLARLAARLEGVATESATVRAARATEPEQIVGLFAELVVSAWEARPLHREKRGLQQRIATNLGWADLAAETTPGAAKIELALHTATPESTRRAVQLLLPMVD
jgi:hypothetical protein